MDFTALVASGTTSKQVASESDALSVGYGSMLLEGALAVLVILACCAGVGMGKYDRQENGTYQIANDSAGNPILGRDAWHKRYNSTGKLE